MRYGIVSLLLILVGAAFAQAPRPPVDKLSKLTDVSIPSPANNDVLTYETSSSKWKNKPGGGGGVSDGDKGDITVTGSGTIWTIDNNAVTYGKIQNVGAGKLLGRESSGAGIMEEVTLGTNLSLSGTTLNATGGPSQLTFNLKTDYGAKGDGKIVTNAAITTGTNTLTSASNPWVSGDVGKIIYVSGAVAGTHDLVTTISGFNNAGSITLTANATQTSTGAFAIWGTDDTSSLQSAITASSGGGQILAPHGIYIFNGELQTSGGYNAQIKLPNVASHGVFPLPPIITILGDVPQNIAWSLDTPSTNGTIFFSTLATGSGTRPAFIGGPHIEANAFPDNFTGISVSMRDISIVTHENPALSMLDFLTVITFELRHVNVGAWSIPQLPTVTTSAAIITPAEKNGAHNYMQNVAVGGFYTGYRWSETVVADDIQAGKCVVGIDFQLGSHDSQISRFLSYGVPYGLFVSGSCYVNIDNYDMERLTSGIWNTLYDLYDTSGLLQGTIKFHAVNTPGGISTTFTRSTGTKATVIGLDDGIYNAGSGGSNVTTGLIPGTAPAYPGQFNMYCDQNTTTHYIAYNSYNGDAAKAEFNASNGTYNTYLGMTSPSFTNNGTIQANTSYLLTDANEFVLSTTALGGQARLANGFRVGNYPMQADPPVGVIDAKVGYRINGASLPFSGGTSGQLLAKNSNTDFDWHWIDAAGGGNVSNNGTPTLDQTSVWTDATHIKGVTTLKGGTTSQVLSKSSNTDYDWAWTTPSASGNVSTSGTITTGQLAEWTDATHIRSDTTSQAQTAIGATTVGGNLLTLTNPSAITFPKINADNTVTAESASTHRTSIGGTTVGQNVFTLTNPSAITFLKVAADNSVSAESASTHRTSLGATTVGGNLFTLTNPSAITFPKINADNSVTAESASTHRTSIGATTVGGNLFTLTNPSAITFLKINADNTITTEAAGNHLTSLGGTAAGVNIFKIGTPGSSSFIYVAADNSVSYGAAPSSAVVGISDAQTLTNKRINPRTNSTASNTSWTPASDSYDEEIQTALAGDLTINAPSGTPVQGQRLILRITSNGSSHNITVTTGSSGAFRAIGVTLPTSIAASKTIYMGCIYNTDAARWDVVAVATEA